MIIIAFDKPMTRQLSFAVDGVVENFLERSWQMLLKIDDSLVGSGCQLLCVARRHTKNCLHSLRKAILRFGWSWGEKEFVWVGELIRCRVGRP